MTSSQKVTSDESITISNDMSNNQSDHSSHLSTMQKSPVPSASKTVNYKPRKKYGKKLHEKYRTVCGQLKRQKDYADQILATCRELDKNNKFLIEEADVMRIEIKKYKQRLEEASNMITTLKEKLGTAESNWPGADKMKSRLAAANQTMAKQRRQIEEIQNQLESRKHELNNIRSKLSRSEVVGTNRQKIIERLRSDLVRWETQAKDFRERNESLRNELKAEKELLAQQRCLLSKLSSENHQLQLEKSEQETAMNNHIMALERKVTDLKKQLVQKDVDAEELAKRTMEKFTQLKKSMCLQIERASSKLVKSDNKIKELYSTLEILIMKVHKAQNADEGEGKTNMINEDAVKAACTLLKVDPAQVHEILDNNTENKITLKKWLQTFQSYINKDVFANQLSEYLFDLITGST